MYLYAGLMWNLLARLPWDLKYYIFVKLQVKVINIQKDLVWNSISCRYLSTLMSGHLLADLPNQINMFRYRTF